MNKNKVAVITGGSSGFGKATASQLFSEEAKVVIVGRNKHNLELTCKEIGSIDSFCCDVTSYEQWTQLRDYVVGKYGKIDYLLNIAGAGITLNEFCNQSKEQLEQAVYVNLLGPMYGMHVFAKDFIRQHGGTIINVASVCATHAWPGFSAYAAAKAGLLMLSKSIYVELRQYDVRVTCLIPGSGMTNFRANANLSPVEDNVRKLHADEVANVICDICRLPMNTVIENVTVWGLDQQVIPL